MRAFIARVLVAIDDEEAIQEEQRDSDAGPVSLPELTDYLKDAVKLDLDVENHSNPCGVQSVELDWSELRELSAGERQSLYGK